MKTALVIMLLALTGCSTAPVDPEFAKQECSSANDHRMGMDPSALFGRGIRCVLVSNGVITK